MQRKDQFQLKIDKACKATESRSDDAAGQEEVSRAFNGLVVYFYFRHGLERAQSVGIGVARHIHLLWGAEPKVGGKSGEA